MACNALLRSGKPCQSSGKYDAPNGMRLCGRHIRTSTHEDCSVCLTEIQSKASCKVLSKCGHAFHTRCIRTWLRRGVMTCPVCRAPCIAELRDVRGSITNKLQMLIRTLPPPPGTFFPAYVIGMLTSPPVQDALDLDDDRVQMLIDIAYAHETEGMFYRALRVNFI